MINREYGRIDCHYLMADYHQKSIETIHRLLLDAICPHSIVSPWTDEYALESSKTMTDYGEEIDYKS